MLYPKQKWSNISHTDKETIKYFKLNNYIYISQSIKKAKSFTSQVAHGAGAYLPFPD